MLDCEAVAWDKVEKKLLPFQEITKRKRKDVKVEDITVKVHLFAFDILYLNGEVRPCLVLLFASHIDSSVVVLTFDLSCALQ